MAVLILARPLLFWVAFVAAEPGAIRIPLRHNPVPYVRARGGNGVPDLPMTGSDQRFGEYTVDVVIGGQVFSLMLDTGSSDLAVGAKGCSGCEVKLNRPYDPKRSGAIPLDCDWCDAHAIPDTTKTTCKVVHGIRKKQCTFMMAYADESHFSALLYNDTFTFAMGESGIAKLQTNVVVGAMYRANFQNPKMVDGIIGFGGFRDTTTGAPSPFKVLVSEGKLQDIFSICLHPNGNGGHLYLGADGPPSGDATRTQSTSMMIQGTRILETQWTPMLTKTGFYGVDVKDVLVDGVSIGVKSKVYNAGDAIVDSGTQDVSFPESAYKAVKEHFYGLCKKGVCLKGVCDCIEKRTLTKPIFETRCVRMTQADKDKFPMIEIKMAGGVTVQYPPSNYLKNGAAFCDDVDIDHYTIAISSSGKDEDEPGSILGESLMQGYLIVHDRETYRMGFQPVSEDNCPGMLAERTVYV